MRMSAAVIDYQDGDLTYKLNTEPKTAELAKCSDKASEAIIRENISYEGVTYSVTALGDYCFQDCAALTYVTIPSSVTIMGNDCFYNCPVLHKVICEIPTAINGSSLFRATPIEEATLYVPEASLASYKATSPWSDFGAILPISGTGIESTTVSEPTIEAIYNFEGKQMNHMSRGLNILHMSDGTTKKVLNLRER